MEGYFVPLRPEKVSHELKEARILSGLLAPFAGLILGFLYRRFKKRASIPPTHADHITIEKVEVFNGEFDTLWERFIKEKRIITIKRSSKYLNWRYSAKPDHVYDIFVARDKGGLVGYLICTTVKRQDDFNVNLRIGVTSDYLVLKGYEHLLGPLFHRAVNTWISKDCDCAINWIHPDSLLAIEMKQQLKKTGFVSMLGKYRIPISVRALRDDVSKEDMSIERNWFFTLAFSGRWA
jgi:hypothetical protein